MALGPWSYSDTAVPSNINLADIERYAFSDGVSVAEAVAYAYDQARAFNDNRMGNRAVALLLDLLCAPPTNDQMINYYNGSVEWHDDTEYGDEQIQRVSKAGAVCIPREKTAKIGMSWRSLRKSTSDDFVAMVGRWLDGAASAKRADLLQTTGIATTARTHPSGNGSASPSWIGGGSQNYVPPDYNGISFSSDDHIDDNQADSAAGRLAAFKAMRNNLWEHGYYSEPGAPIMILHGPDTLSDIQGVTGYSARKQPFVDYAPGGTTTYGDIPEVDVSTFHGVWTTGGCWCVQVGGIPDNYFFMVKSFGMRSPLNPVQQWVPEDIGASLIMKNLNLSPPENVSPIETLEGFLSWGFGVRDPAAGCVSLIAGSGTYTDPTIT